MKLRHTALLLLAIASFAWLVASCSSNNCPLENTVVCNYYFYDSEGTAITYNDTLTVTTLLPGMKTVYVYRKFGSPTLTLDKENPQLTEQGYTVTSQQTRRDTVLVNKAVGKANLQIPMSYYNDADTLIFNYSGISRNDTVIVSHTNRIYVDLPECGSHQFHDLTDVRATDAAIDRIEINNPQVNYEGNENVKIYFNGTAL